MEPDFLRQALFVTAVAAECRELDYIARGQMVSRAMSSRLGRNAEIVEWLTATAKDIDIPASLIRRLRPSLLQRAFAHVGDWLAADIGVVRREELFSSPHPTDDFPAVLFTRGDTSLLERTRAAIVCSRKPRGVTSQDGWIASIKCMVDYAVTQGFPVVSSIGALPYSLTCRAARGSPLIVICDDILPFMLAGAKCAEFLERTAGLFDPERTLFLSPFAPGKTPLRPYRMTLRDRLIAALASVILAADVRPGGNMHEILEDAARRNVGIYGLVRNCTAVARIGPVRPSEVIHAAVPLCSRQTTKRLIKSDTVREVDRVGRIAAGAIPVQHGPDTSLEAACLGRGFLIHYTRRCPGPWPGQSPGEYCQTLIDGRTDSGHSAFDTLNRILVERVIRGGMRLTRGQQRVVSFTECLPQELESVVSWRKGLIRWSFEPYGIAVRKSILMDRGARRVIYGGEEIFRKLPDPDKPFFQLIKQKGHEWSVEKEWRVAGDLDLLDVPRSHVVVIVPTREEAIAIANRHDVPVTWRGVQAGR